MLFRDSPEIIPGHEGLASPDRVIHFYDITNIEQYQGLRYEDMAGRVHAVMENPALKNNADLVVDGTGVGDAAVELIRKRGLSPVPIVFTGGGAAREVHEELGKIFGPQQAGSLRMLRAVREIRVPKKDLVAAGAVLMQQGRLRVAPGRWKEDFLRQLGKFKGKVSKETGNRKFEAESEGDHDDLVVNYLMGAWWILNRRGKGGIEERRLGAKEDTAAWEPGDYM
jgi:hypothetical protein